jgi:hypothetical protein
MQERRKRAQEFRSVLVARGICADVRDADGGAVGAKVACPRVLTLVDGEARDREADDRVEPPPAQGGVGEDAHQDPGGGYCAEPGLGGIAGWALADRFWTARKTKARLRTSETARRAPALT